MKRRIKGLLEIFRGDPSDINHHLVLMQAPHFDTSTKDLYTAFRGIAYGKLTSEPYHVLGLVQ